MISSPTLFATDKSMYYLYRLLFAKLPLFPETSKEIFMLYNILRFRHLVGKTVRLFCEIDIVIVVFCLGY